MAKEGDCEPIRWRRRFAGGLVFLLAGLAGGCGTEQSVYLLGAGLATFIQTDKLPSDFIAELATGKECSTLKAMKDHGPLCRDSFEKTVFEKPSFCYRSLAEITCYNEPDPFGPTNTRVR